MTERALPEIDCTEFDSSVGELVLDLLEPEACDILLHHTETCAVPCRTPFADGGCRSVARAGAGARAAPRLRGTRTGRVHPASPGNDGATRPWAAAAGRSSRAAGAGGRHLAGFDTHRTTNPPRRPWSPCGWRPAGRRRQRARVGGAVQWGERRADDAPRGTSRPAPTAACSRGLMAPPRRWPPGPSAHRAAASGPCRWTPSCTPCAWCCSTPTARRSPRQRSRPPRPARYIVVTTATPGAGTGPSPAALPPGRRQGEFAWLDAIAAGSRRPDSIRAPTPRRTV